MIHGLAVVPEGPSGQPVHCLSHTIVLRDQPDTTERPRCVPSVHHDLIRDATVVGVDPLSRLRGHDPTERIDFVAYRSRVCQRAIPVDSRDWTRRYTERCERRNTDRDRLTG